MNINDLGYSSFFENYRKEQGLENFGVARVITEHKERYMVRTADKEYEAEIVGNLRFSAIQRSDFPAVGDWVAISEYEEDKVLIHKIFPRKTSIERQAVGKHGETQIIATNIDYGFIIQAVDRDFNINRIERYLTICSAAGVDPIILLNKIDLIDTEELKIIKEKVQSRIKNIPVLAISNNSQEGITELAQFMQEGMTYCLLGSSGVGKSSLVNNLLGKDLMEVNTISTSNNKGRHVTSHRELIVLDNGAILIDNPGMREVGVTDSNQGLESTFEDIFELSRQCKYKDCTHTNESGCAVLQALDDEEINAESYENFMKMEKEKAFFESSKADRKKKGKELGKLIKHYKKQKGID